MTTVPTLYSIFFDYIKNHTQDLISLDGVPYKPTVENIINYLFTSDVPLNYSVLSVIPHAHSKALRAANLPWTQLVFDTLTCSVYPMLMTMSRNFPKFITHLKIGATDLCDDDIFLLSGFTNLRVLDLQHNQNISDRTVSYITTMALNISNGKGLPYLEELYLDRVKGITDKSLKFIGKLISLSYISLTGTQITSDVAKTYLQSKGFEIAQRPRKRNTELFDNFKFYLFIEKSSSQYDIPPGRKLYRSPSDRDTSAAPPFLEFRRKITHATIRATKNIPLLKQKPPPAKRQKLTTNDFFAMVENELADDDY